MEPKVKSTKTYTQDLHSGSDLSPFRLIFVNKPSEMASRAATQKILDKQCELLDLKALPCVGQGGDLFVLDEASIEQLRPNLCPS